MIRLKIPRIPFFLVFYSVTYTLLYIVTLVFLSITPISMIYGSFKQGALQYAFMIGGAYVLTAVLAIFIYCSRLYTNRSILSAVGKAYVPIEDGEVGKMVRKMIVKQLERSAIVAWESRPRDLYLETMIAEQSGNLHAETMSVGKKDHLVGTEIRVDPERPPWGDVQHPGWSSPSHMPNNKTPNVQYDNVIQELPHLIEARAVSLAPPDPTATPVPGEPRNPDPLVVELLKRSANMAAREYLIQLSQLGLIQPADVGERFLSLYERARFKGEPVSIADFNSLMDAFANLLSGMTGLDPAIVHELRTQLADSDAGVQVPTLCLPQDQSQPYARTPSPQVQSARSSATSHVTARERASSRATIPYMRQHAESRETLGSVIHHDPDLLDSELHSARTFATVRSTYSSSSFDVGSDTGSVLIHDIG